MANITLSGTLLDPNSGFAARDKIRFTHKTTTGSTLKGSVSTLVIGADGAYSIDLQYGLVLVERRDSTKSQYINLGVVTVNADNPATTLPELLSATVPVSSEELIEFQSILADCVAAQEAAEAAAAEAAQLGNNTGASLVGTSSGATVQQSLDALTAGQIGGVIVFTTYALLDAYTPQNATEEKSSFKVTNDSNTALNGYYSWVSGTAYTKDADLANGVVESGNVDAVSGGTVFNHVEPISISADRGLNNSWAEGLSEKYPNLHDDPSGETNVGRYLWSSGFNPIVVDNRPAQKVDAAHAGISLEIDNPQEAFPSGFISAGALWMSKAGGGRVRQLILQYNGGVEIERDTIQFGSAVVISEPVWYGSVGVPLNPAATRVLHYFDGGTDDEAVFTNFCIADGAIDGFRKPLNHTDLGPINSLLGQIDSSLDFLSNKSFDTTATNLLDDPTFTDKLSWLDGDKISITWDASINKNVANVDAGLTRQELLITDQFDGATTFSWSTLLVGSFGSPSGGRIFVIQQDSGGSELSRTEIKPLSLYEPLTTLSIEDIPIEAGLAKIQFYLDGGATDGSGWIFTDVCLRKGSESQMGLPLAPKQSQINLLSDPNMVNADIFGNTISIENDAGVVKLTATNNTAIEGARFYESAIGNFAQGTLLYFSCTSLFSPASTPTNEKFSLDILFIDSVGSEISRISVSDSVSDVEEFLFVNGKVPAGTTTIQIRPTWTGTVGNPVSGEIYNIAITLANPALVPFISLNTSTSNALSIAYVSSLGNDANSGGQGSPVLSFNKAAELIGGVGTIIVIDDGYYEPQTISGNNAIDINIMGDNADKPHIRGGERQTGWTLEGGETNVWYTSANEFNTGKSWIFEGFKNDQATLITDEERESQHGGRSHRLEHTKLYRQTNLTALKASSHGFWYDTVNSRLYVKPANVYSDIETAWITYPTSFGLSCSATGRVRIQDIVVDFAGVNISRSAYAELYNVESIGALNNGLTANDVRGIAYNCRWGASGNDGQNFHNTLDIDILGTVFHLYNSWCHDSRDDGDSMHEHCVGYYMGGLYEYNQDRGTAPSYGSHTSYHSVKTKYNGYLQTPSVNSFGEGFGMVGENAEAGSYGTSTECFNCIDVGSNIGFANHASDASAGEYSTMKLYNCRSDLAKSAAFSAKNGSTLVINNCYEYNTLGVIKYTDTGGIVEIKNASLVI